MVLALIVYSIGPAVVLGYLAHRFYFAGGHCKSKKRLDGKVTIVTGSNCGIGYETALDFAKRGAHVILACRDLKRSQPAADKIILESSNNKVEVEILDLASQQSVRDFAERIKKRFKRIDILVNNAGLFLDDRSETVDGIETTFATNHLGPFLLTNLLLDEIKAAAPSRIVNVSSMGHTSAFINWDDLQMKTGYGGFKAYVQSKLANILFTRSLAKRLEGTEVITSSLHPGGVRTEIWRGFFKNINIKSILAVLSYPIFLVVMKDCVEGAQTTLHCALDDEEVPNRRGEYFSDCHYKKTSKRGANMEDAERLWTISAKMVGLDK